MFACYYQEILNHLTRVFRNRDNAADIVQETYVRALALQRSGKIVSQPRALLYRIARNLVIDSYRHKDICPYHVSEQDALEELEALTAPATVEPETVTASYQAVETLLGVIDSLPTRCREAFVLHRFDGLLHTEVAARMGISRKMVEQHIKLAIDTCRRCKEQMDAR